MPLHIELTDSEWERRVNAVRRLLPTAEVSVKGGGTDNWFFSYPETGLQFEIYRLWPNYIGVTQPIGGNHRRDNVTLERLENARHITEIL